MYIDEWFGTDFYRQLPLGFHANFVFGQLFWTHAYYPHESLELWRPVPNPDEPTKSIAKTFHLQSAGKDAFRRRFPLHVPALETNEEFIVVRAKVRPVILLQPEGEQPTADNKGYRGRFNRRRCLIGQIFGLSDVTTGHTEFNPAIIDRIRRMEFPQLLFMPKKPGILEVDSMLKLDEIQSVFVTHLQPTQTALGSDITEVLRHQLEFLITRRTPSPYTELREMLLHE